MEDIKITLNGVEMIVNSDADDFDYALFEDDLDKTMDLSSTLEQTQVINVGKENE